MTTQKIINVLSRIFGLGDPHPEPLDKHAPQAEYTALRSRGMPHEAAFKECAQAVMPAVDANDAMHCLRDAIMGNDQLAKKRFLLTLANELERDDEPKKKNRE